MPKSASIEWGKFIITLMPGGKVVVTTIIPNDNETVAEIKKNASGSWIEITRV